jgi:flavin-dependent dehydrogenase
MTPKEKAQELVDKYYIFNHIGNRHAIKCALIAVDEIIESNPIAFDEEDNCIEKNWWKEVKKQIELL